MPRKSAPPDHESWTPNQIVAYRIAEARKLRGWTQEAAAQALESFLGTRLSPASFSAIERSFQGGRIRLFDADEIVAFARGFGLPIGWFLTPPPRHREVRVATPDAGRDGLDPMILIDLVLGDAEALLHWNRAFVEFNQDPTTQRLAGTRLDSDEEPVMPDRLNDLVRLRARARLSKLFGDTTSARDTLVRLSELLLLLEDDEIEAVRSDVDRAESSDITLGLGRQR